MKRIIILLMMFMCMTASADAAILVFTGNGSSAIYTTKPTLEAARTAADAAGKTVVVTSALTQAQSNILAAWPADRALRIEKGGSIANSTTFTVNGPFEAGLQHVFTGSGTVSFGGNIIHESYPEWFGTNTTPGTTDMTSAINKAIASLNSTYYGTVKLSSYYLISSTISVPAAIKLAGLGTSGTRIYKAASMTTTGIIMEGFNSQLESLGILADLGATGDGIQIANANVVLTNVDVHGAGKTTPSGNGIRIGKDTGPSNCNFWKLDNVRVVNMSGHGVYISDKPGGNPDANAGTAIHVETDNNGGDGIKEFNGWLNTYVGCLAQSNTNGFNFSGDATSASKFSSIIGGDFEANTVDVLVNSFANQSSILGLPIGTIITDNSITTKRLERTIKKMGTWTPVLAGDTVAGTQTYAVQSGWYFRDGDMITIQGRITLSAKDAATAGSMRITGLPFACATITNGIFPAAFSTWGGITFPANYTAMGGFIPSGQSYISLTRNGSAQTSTAVLAAEMVAPVLIFSATYPVSVF